VKDKIKVRIVGEMETDTGGGRERELKKGEKREKERRE